MTSTNGDMGPFAGMAPALERAISSYGTPPYRQNVTVKVREVGHYSFEDLPSTIEGWMDWLAQARTETPAEYREQLNCVLGWEAGYYDSGDSASFDIWYERPETDAEMTKRVNQGIAYVRSQEDRERSTYEALKQKFDTRS